MEIVSTFTSSFGDLCSGLASTVVTTFDTVMTTTDGKLSNIAIWGITFMGVAGGLGLINWLRGLAT